MSDIERAKQALRSAHAAGDTESAQKLADFIRSAETPERSPASTFVSRGVATTLGAPMDILAAGARATGIAPEGFEPVLGRAGIEKGLDAASQAIAGVRMTPLPDEQPETLGARVARGVGEVAGAALPMGGLARSLSAGTGAVGQAARGIMETVARRPGASAALEGIAGAGAGAGGHYAGRAAEGTPYRQQAEMMGEMIGGIGAPLAAAGVARYNLPAVGYRVGKKMLTPYTESGARIRAEETVQGMVSDPRAAAQRMQQERISELSPAQRTESPELMALEARIAQSTPEEAARRAEQIRSSRERLMSEITPTGSGQTARAEIENRTNRIIEQAQTMRDEAQAGLAQRLETLSPEQRGSQAAVVAREELENALSTARARENELWSQVPGAGIPTGGLKREYSKILMETPLAQRDNIPEIAQRMLGSNGQFPSAVNINELQGLRSELLEQSRIARAAGQNNRARISDKIADAVLEEMGAASGRTTGPVGEAMREALDFSRSLNEAFRQGSVGRILAPDRLGGDRIAPERTLEAIIGAGRVRGDVGISEIMTAADTPQTRQAVTDYMLERLNRAAVRDGQLNPNSAENFLRDNADILDRFPQVRENIADAIKMQRDVDRLSGRADQIERSLSSTQKSIAGRVLNSQVDAEIDAVMRAQNPQNAARQLRQMVRNNPDAVEGLQASAMEYLISRSKTGSTDAFGNDIVSGNKMMKSLLDKKQRSVLTEIMGEEAVNRAERVARELSILEKADSVSALSKIIDDAPNMLVEAIGTTAGARFGAKLGAGTSGASLKTASFMSKQASNILKKLTGSRAEKLLVRAVHDPELFEALLTTSVRTPSGQMQAAQKFEAWLMGTGLRLLEDDDILEQE